MAVAKRSGSRASAKKQVDFMKAVSDVGTPLAFIGGMALGNELITKMAKSTAVKGLLGTEVTQKYLVPVGTTLLGLVVPQLFKHKLVKIGGYGVAAAGLRKTIEVFTGKNLLSGLGLFNGNDQYEVPANVMQEIAAAPNSQYLPMADIDIEKEIEKDLNGDDLDNDSINGAGDTDPFIDSDDLGDVDDYDDIDDEE